MKVLHVVGARPNFMKVAPIMREMAKDPDEFEQILVHTGQHYDEQMSRVFFEELEMPRPEVNLEVGSGTHAWQTAQVMLRFEPVIQDFKPDWVVVAGDVNSTLACALVCIKLGIKVAHVEAGLRSYDRSMPEEINRLLTDQISDLLFTPSEDANANLVQEGVFPEKIHLVGNVMVDTLVRLLPKARARWAKLQAQFELERYLLVTLHRPSNVDDPKTLKEILGALGEVSKDLPVLFPVHPRTRERIEEFGLQPVSRNLQLLEPLGYLDFLALQAHAGLVLTDSGGIQEETTYLGVSCLTARPNTERPVTVTIGTNQLVESHRDALLEAIRGRLAVEEASRNVPPLWDGVAAKRIVSIFRKL
ncbi:MAG TPA: UDP-N-acetylglucosamine 2-epimerase (non-hydrolyzing) [Anaerolineales bacterium]